MAIRKCVGNLTVEKLNRLDAICREHRAAVGRKDLIGSLHVIRSFHVTIFELAGNEEAKRLFEWGWEVVMALRLQYGYRPGRMEIIDMELERIMSALSTGDVVAAESMIRMHNRAGLEDLLENF
jgi:DNA-binding GntR family transcriptional regulator